MYTCGACSDLGVLIVRVRTESVLTHLNVPGLELSELTLGVLFAKTAASYYSQELKAGAKAIDRSL